MDVRRGPLGRVVAASVAPSDGPIVRVLAVYGPTGGCSRSCPRDPEFLDTERQVVAFIESEAAACDAQGWHLIVSGDPNSYTSASLDQVSGDPVIREENIAVSMSRLGLRDSFRERHPALAAVTYVSTHGTAARLDQTWVRGAMGCELQVVNAAIVWAWPRRRDHDPVVCDVLCDIPAAPPVERQTARRWRQLLAILDDGTGLAAARSSTAAALAPIRPSIEAAMMSLQHVCAACGRNADGSLPENGLGSRAGGIAPWQAEASSAPSAHRRIIEDAHDAIERGIVNCLPWPRSARGSRCARRASGAWDECVSLLRVLRGVARCAVSMHPQRLQQMTQSAADAWARGRTLTARNESNMARMPRRVFQGSDTVSDHFSQDPAAWAIARGFSRETALSWSACHRSCDAMVTSLQVQGDVPDVCAALSQWSCLDHTQRMATVNNGLQYAVQARARCFKVMGRDFVTSRRSAMRQGNLGKWARMLRGPTAKSAGYAAPASTHAGSTRPVSPASAREAVSAEWTRLLCEPPVAWLHPFVNRFTDAGGRIRGCINVDAAMAAPPGSLGARAVAAYVGPPGCGIQFVRWTPQDIVVVDAEQANVAGWRLRKVDDGWEALCVGPVVGDAFKVVSISGENPALWNMDRWSCASSTIGNGSIVLLKNDSIWGDLVRPTTPQERVDLVRRRRSSRPGESSWKLAFLQLCPHWAQQAYWQLVDTQRACGIIASANKRVVQVNMEKPNGGWRPLSMLEESFKAIEGPVASRRAQSRRPLPLGAVYSSTNLAGEGGRRASGEVLYTDVLICEDSLRHGRPLCRVPADEEKFFNAVEWSSVEAVDECRGIPDSARRLICEAFQGMQVSVETRWGPAPDIVPTRGFAQGSISGPEQAKPAHEPMLRLRESSPAYYTTSAGRAVACAGYVDDVEHYGAGAADLPTIFGELEAGSVMSRVGLAWGKFSAYATDWEAFAASDDGINLGLRADGLYAAGWDIWRGERCSSFVPRALLASEEKLLGKRGCIGDRHSLAAADVVAKLRKVRTMCQIRRASWDEASLIAQLFSRGIIAYCPLVGIPRSQDLHGEDAALHRLIVANLGTRITAERVSLVASRRAGGMQCPSLVESMVASVAQDLVILLNGSTTAAMLARDALREAMSVAPGVADNQGGMIALAIQFLAGYGVQLCVATDRLVSRMLSYIARRRRIATHLFVGPFHAPMHRSGVDLCCIGSTANSIRQGVSASRLAGTPLAVWGELARWHELLGSDARIEPSECARAAAGALSASARDWVS